jgi:tetratricopeptide (TPR) repeat protein
VTQLLDPQAAVALLKTGNAAFRQGNYPEAIAALSTYQQGMPSGSRSYGQAQMWLAKAYQANGQAEEAIGLCQQMIEGDAEASRIWAQQFLLTLLAPVVNQATGTAENKSSEPAAIERIELKTLEAFKSFCLENLAEDLRTLEKTRHQVLAQILVVGGLVSVVLIALLYFTPTIMSFGRKPVDQIKLLIMCLFGDIGCLWAMVAFYSSSTEAYARGFKGRIIQKIVDFILPDRSLFYSVRGNDEETLTSLIRSKLFPSLAPSSHLSQDDCVSGKIGKTPLFFSEVQVSAEVAGGSVSGLEQLLMSFRPNNPVTATMYAIGLLFRVFKGFPYFIGKAIKGQSVDYKHFEREVIRGESTSRRIFQGLFFVADFNKDFRGQTFLLSNDIGSKIQVLHKGKGQAVSLEDPSFRKLFVVYSNDQVEARYILSTSLMERLVTFHKKLNRKIQISFVDSLIYMAITYEEDLFEPKIFSSMLDLAPLKEYFETLQLMLSIVDELNLNQRIWTKR